MTRLSESLRMFFVLAVTSAVAHADPDPEPVPPETIFVIDSAPDQGAPDREKALGEAPFVTVLHPGDHPATSSVADAVATSAGALESSLGGLGAYQAISVRGAAPGHTSVLIDGVPLARLAAVTTDLGHYPLDAFGEVRFYRGAVPVELGGAGVGGAIDLVTRLGPGPHGERWSASAGVGSYGARHLRAHYGGAHGELGELLSSTTLGYQAATGDYSYFDNGGTLLNKHDDTYKVRGNNGFDQVDAATRFATKDRPLVAGLRLAWKRQGLPGSTAQPAPTAKLSTLDALVDAGGETNVSDWTGHQLGFALFERQGLRDPLGELGLGAASRTYTTFSLGVSSTWRTQLGPHRFAGGAELRGDSFGDHDDASNLDAVTGDRAGGAVLAAIDLVLARQLVVTPAFRLDALHSEPTPMSVGPMAGMPVPTRWDVVPSPRVTALFSVTPDLAIKGSAGLYARLPTLLEVFGNRGFILGTPDLEAERGPSSDLGFVWAPSHAIADGEIDRVLVQSDVFANRAHDTIALITTAGYVTRAANIGDTQGYGAEMIASARVAETLSVTTSYTRLITAQMSNDVNVDGKPVPRRPGHVLYARGDLERHVMHHTGSVWLDGTWQSDSYLDPASLGKTPGRTLIGSGARVEIVPGVALALAVANLADVRLAYLPLDRPSVVRNDAPTPLTDVAGFPLPGRTFYLSLDWTH
jgi:iron complex outermembrane receptor protein